MLSMGVIMEENNNIRERHFQVEDEYDLVDYVYDHFEKIGSIYDVDIDVEPSESDLPTRISGYVNDVYVEIVYNFQRSMILRTNVAGSEEEKTLVRILQPLMWNVDKHSRAPKFKSGGKEVVYTAPIYEIYYPVYGMHEIMWNTYDPERSLKDLAFVIDVLQENFDGLQVYHPSYKLKDLYKSLNVGEYPAGLKPEFVERLSSKSEFEMYLLIVGTRKEIMGLYDKNSDIQDPLVANEIITKHYQLQFLMQQVGKMFNIKVNPPARDDVDPTAEILAWEKWWGNSLKDALLTQDGFMQISNGKFGYNTEFRPKGSYKDYIPECEKLIAKLKSAAAEQNEKS